LNGDSLVSESGSKGSGKRKEEQVLPPTPSVKTFSVVDTGEQRGSDDEVGVFHEAVESRKVVSTSPSAPTDIGYGLRVAVLMRIVDGDLRKKKPRFMVQGAYKEVPSREEGFMQKLTKVMDEYDFSKLPDEGAWVYFQ